SWSWEWTSGKGSDRDREFSGETVSAFAYCAKRDLLATHGVGGVIRLRKGVWNNLWKEPQPDQPREVRRLLTDVDMASAMSFSADGSLLAVAARDGAIQLWDVQTGAVRALGSADRAGFVAFVSDDKALAVFGGGRIVHYEPKSARALRSFRL